MSERPEKGSFVMVPFGSKSRQVAHVEGFTKDGRLKVRAWNATQNVWGATLRTIPLLAKVIPTSGANLPPPPREEIQ